MKRIFTLLIMLSLCGSVQAQQTIETSKHRYGKLILKWSPVHLLDHFSTVQIAVEQRLNQNISLQCDFGPVLNTTKIFSEFTTNARGYKSKIQVRKYLSQQLRFWRFYVAPEIGYNHVSYTRGKTYIHSLNQNVSYYQYIENPSTYREKNVGINAGVRFAVYRFCIDLQIGVVGRFLKFNTAPSPGSEYELVPESKNLFSYSEKSRNEILPSVGLRFGYIIR